MARFEHDHQFGVERQCLFGQRRKLFVRDLFTFNRIHLQAQLGFGLLPGFGSDVTACVEPLSASQHMPVRVWVILGGPGDPLPTPQHR